MSAGWKPGWLLLLACVVSAVALADDAAAQSTELRGLLGADLGLVDFENRIQARSDPFSVRRAISEQFLQLGLQGPLFDSELGSYLLRSRLTGQYYHVGSTTGNESTYENPTPTLFGLDLGLFPSRRYPLRLSFFWSERAIVNYEQENRSIDDQEAPELAAVRRYDSSVQAYNAGWKYGISPTADVVAEYQHENTTSNRQYDFRENLDIFVEFFTPRPDPTLDPVTIIIENTLTEGEVDVVVDGTLVTTLGPAGRFEFPLASGAHDVDFVPTAFNPYRTSIEVNGDMLWTIVYNEPPGRTDLESSRDAGRLEWATGKDQRFANTARFNFSDEFEEIMGRSTRMLELQNDAAFEWSSSMRMLSTTGWTQNESSQLGGSAQKTGSVRQQTKFGYHRLQGGRFLAEHVFDRSGAEKEETSVTTTQNRIRAEAMRPWGPYEHQVTLRNLSTNIGTSEGYGSFETRNELMNSAALYTGQTGWRPRSSLQYARTVRKNPGSKINEFSVREYLEVDRPELWVFGDLLGNVELGWRRRSEGGKIDTTYRYNWGLNLARQLSPDYLVFASASGTNETYDVQLTEADAEAPTTRDPQRQKSMRVRFRATPIPRVSFDTAYSYTTQTDQVQTEFRFDTTLHVPWLNFPITSGFAEQNRDLEGRPTQTTRRWETKFSLSLRNIRVQFEHAYLAETLFFEEYAVNLFQIEIVRAFTMFQNGEPQ